MKFIRKVIRHLLDYANQVSVEEYRAAGIVIGENVAIYNSNIDMGHAFLIEIGNDVTITNATILAHDASTKRDLGYSKVGKVVIGNHVFIGYGSIILPNTVIGNNVIIGAGCIVRDSIPDNSVVVGNPARVICEESEYIEKNREKMKTYPVYETYWEDKPREEKELMKRELEGTMGYDI